MYNTISIVRHKPNYEKLCELKTEGSIHFPREDNNGNLFVTCQSGEIYQFNHEGMSDPILTMNNCFPTCICFDSTGTLYVGESSNNAIYTKININDNSHTVDQILIKDFNDKPLKGPSSLAYNKDDNVLYFTDAGTFLNVSLYPSNGSLYMIDLDSKIMRPIMHNCLSFPSDVVYENKKGIIYVAETLANRIIRLTQNPYGVYHSSVFYQFNGRLGPTAMAVDESGNLYVARYEFQIGLDGNDYDGIISVINRHGRLIGELIIPNLSEISGLLISSKKKEILYMTEKNSNHVYAIKLSSFLGELDKIDEMNKVFNYN